MEEKKIAAGLLAICPETGKFLMLKRRSDVLYPKYWATPGGSLEKGEYPKKTAIREFKEETGYNGIMKISKEPLCVYKTNLLDFYTYVCILPWEFEVKTKGECEGGVENINYGWFPVDYKWGSDEKLMPSFFKMMEQKRSVILKVVNKFKEKNF